jgi:hypothetical protein
MFSILQFARAGLGWLAAAVLRTGVLAASVQHSVRLWIPVAPTEEDAALLNDDGCIGDAPCPFAREVFVDYAAYGVAAGVGGEWITYDLDAVTRPVTPAQLRDEPELSLAVRLVLSEVGADRLLLNRNGVLEAIGILYTVDNRLDPLVYNVEDRPEAPVFPGCGEAGRFATCANPEQYLGMGTWRALNPASHYDEPLLEAAADLAVVAWWLQEHGYVDDFTRGATSYVHRCGAAGYGEPTTACDAHLGRPAGDVPGADPHTGPTVFKAPGAWVASRGVYALIESRQIEYDPWYAPEAGDALADAADLPVAPSRFGSADEADPEALGEAAFAGATPVAQRALLQRILTDRRR